VGRRDTILPAVRFLFANSDKVDWMWTVRAATQKLLDPEQSKEMFCA